MYKIIVIVAVLVLGYVAEAIRQWNEMFFFGFGMGVFATVFVGIWAYFKYQEKTRFKKEEEI